MMSCKNKFYVVRQQHNNANNLIIHARAFETIEMAKQWTRDICDMSYPNGTKFMIVQQVDEATIIHSVSMDWKNSASDV